MPDPLLALMRALALVFQSGLVGGAVFALAVADKDGRRRALRLAALAALAAALSSAAFLALMLRELMAGLDLSLAEAWGADFVDRHLAVTATALVASLLCALRRMPSALAVAAALAVVAASALSGHAAERLDDRMLAVAADFLHQSAAGAWLGGIPFLLLALRSPDGAARIRQCRRFSALALVSVAVLVLSAALLARLYVGSWAGMIGSDFGATAAVKAVLLAGLLLLGLGNLRAGPRVDQPAALARLRAFAAAEIAIGIAVLVAAASLSALPPPAGAPEQVMAPAEVLARLVPDGAEASHHWAGLMVLCLGLLAFLRGVPGARRWPLVFPGACVLGAILLLLIHGHPADARAALPIHLSHMALAILGLAAGAGRWIELTADAPSRRVAGWMWPIALMLAGIVLLASPES